MKKTIHKKILAITDRQFFNLGTVTRILAVANQNGSLCMWYETNAESSILEQWEIAIVGTGNELWCTEDKGYKYVGTAVVNPYVWHVYAKRAL